MAGVGSISAAEQLDATGSKGRLCDAHAWRTGLELLADFELESVAALTRIASCGAGSKSGFENGRFQVIPNF